MASIGHTNHAASYNEACRMAAKAQGLDPLTHAVAATTLPDDVTYGVEQTGGFMMVATFTRGDNVWTVTYEDDAWLVIRQPLSMWSWEEDYVHEDPRVIDYGPVGSPADVIALVVA